MFSAKTRRNWIRTMRHVFFCTALLLPVAAHTQEAIAKDKNPPGEFDFAELFFELNNSDGDLGIHSLIDGEPWKYLKIKDRRGRELLGIKVKGPFKKQGLTELFFESAEPSFDDLAPIDFFNRHKAGTYTVIGKTLEGQKLINRVELTHVMPAPVSGISLSGGDIINIDDIDCEEGEDVPLLASDGPVIISWDEVTESHPDPDGGGAGVQPPVEVAIVNYEVVLEVEMEDEFTSVISVLLPPEITSFEVPADFISLGDEFKYEILAREASYNQTAIESCFAIDED